MNTVNMTSFVLDKYFRIVAISGSDQDLIAGIVGLAVGIRMILFHGIIARKAIDNVDIEPLGVNFVRLVIFLVGCGFIIFGIGFIVDASHDR
jgi:hypothetical protein